MSPDEWRTAVDAAGDPVVFTDDVRALYMRMPPEHRRLVAHVLAQDLDDSQREWESLVDRLAVVTRRRDAFRQRLDYLAHLDGH